MIEKEPKKSSIRKDCNIENNLELKEENKEFKPNLTPGFLNNKNNIGKQNLDDMKDIKYEVKKNKEPEPENNKNEQNRQQVNKEDAYLNHIKEFRKTSQLPEEDFSDQILFGVLRKANFNYQVAFVNLFN